MELTHQKFKDQFGHWIIPHITIVDVTQGGAHQVGQACQGEQLL